MKKIVIASACRTAIGKFGGTLANVPAVELGSIVIKEALNRANVKPEQVDHVYMGCVIPQAGLGQNVARQAALKAGLPIGPPAVTVKRGLRLWSELCVNMAAQMIEASRPQISLLQAAWRTWTWLPFAMIMTSGRRLPRDEIVPVVIKEQKGRHSHFLITMKAPSGAASPEVLRQAEAAFTKDGSWPPRK